MTVPLDQNNKSYLCRMKIVSKNAVLLIVMAVFCFIITAKRNDTTRLYPTSSMERPGDPGQQVSLKAEFLFSHAIQPDNISSGISKLPTSESKNQYNHFSGFFKSSGFLFLTTLSKYISLSKYFTVGLLQSDIIFPFHTFW